MNFDPVHSQSSHTLLTNLISVSQGMQMRQEILEYKHNLADLSVSIDMSKSNNEDESHVLLDHEERQKITNVCNVVKEGRMMLLSSLKEHAEINKRIMSLESTIINTKIIMNDIINKINTLEGLHEDFMTPNMKELLKNMEEKQRELINDMQSNQIIENINKDKVEAKIKLLGLAYNVFKNTPIVHICPICFHNAVDVYYDPCGHTLCNECSLQNGFHCHICRMKIKETRPIYFSY
jgi:hypothetical protein